MDDELLQVLNRIADALERQSPIPPAKPELDRAAAWIWQGKAARLEPVGRIAAVPLELLQGVEQVGRILLANTRQFANGLPANNALLWGARGMGKSSLVKAVFNQIHIGSPQLRLVEVHRDEITTLPVLLDVLAGCQQRIILFCDDLSFDGEDESYKSLKAVLDGSIAGRPDNVVVYATSNRRHLMPREMMENERKTAIHASEGIEEKVSLSDRFGLWLGFYGCDQQSYLQMVDSYAAHFGLTDENLHTEALAWAAGRGSRSGRVAWQFISDLAGRRGRSLT